MSCVAETTQEGGGGDNEIQVISVPYGLEGGTFTLTFDGEDTTSLDYNATAAEVESALEALTTVDDVTVTKGIDTWTITFGGTQANTNVDPIRMATSDFTLYYRYVAGSTFKMNNPGCPCCVSATWSCTIGTTLDSFYSHWCEIEGEWSYGTNIWIALNYASTEDADSRLLCFFSDSAIWDPDAKIADDPHFAETYQVWWTGVWFDGSLAVGDTAVVGVTDPEMDNQVYVKLTYEYSGEYGGGQSRIGVEPFRITSSGAPVSMHTIQYTEWSDDVSSAEFGFLYDEDYNRFHYYLENYWGSGSLSGKLSLSVGDVVPMRRLLLGTDEMGGSSDPSYVGVRFTGKDKGFSLSHRRCWWEDDTYNNTSNSQRHAPCEATVTISGVALGLAVSGSEKISHWSWFNDSHSCIVYDHLDPQDFTDCGAGDSLTPSKAGEYHKLEANEGDGNTPPHTADEMYEASVSLYASYDGADTTITVECYMYCGYYGASYINVVVLAKFRKTVTGRVDLRTWSSESIDFDDAEYCWMNGTPSNTDGLIDWTGATCSVTANP